MSEAVEYSYKSKTPSMVFATTFWGFGTYFLVQDALLHKDAMDWIMSVIAGMSFASYALKLSFLPYSDKTLRLTETELQIPCGWKMKTCKIPFDEIEKIEQTRGLSGRQLTLTIQRRKERMLVDEKRLSNADAFDKVSKILFEETKKYTGQTTIPLRTERVSEDGLPLTVSRTDTRTGQEKKKSSDNQDSSKT